MATRVHVPLMHLSRCIAYLIIVTVFISFATPVLAKPQPPKEMDGLFERFGKVGASISSRKWELATAETDTIKQHLVTLYPELKKHSSPDMIFQFGSLMDDLKNNVAKKNQSGSLISLAALQSLFVRVMDSFEYNNPPVLSLLDRNLVEAKSEFDAGRYDGVTREMQENIVLHGHAQKFLKERGASQPDIDELKMAMISTKMASQVSDRTETGSGLGKVTVIWKRLFKAN